MNLKNKYLALFSALIFMGLHIGLDSAVKMPTRNPADKFFKQRQNVTTSDVSNSKVEKKVSFLDQPLVSEMTKNIAKGFVGGAVCLAVLYGLKKIYSLYKERTLRGMSNESFSLELGKISDELNSVIKIDVERIQQMASMHNPEMAAELQKLPEQERAQAGMMQQVMMQVSASYAEAQHKAALMQESESGLPFIEHAAKLNVLLQHADLLIKEATHRLESLAFQQRKQIDEQEEEELELLATELSESLQQLKNSALFGTATLLMITQTYEFSIEQVLNKKVKLVNFVHPHIIEEFSDQLQSFMQQMA